MKISFKDGFEFKFNRADIHIPTNAISTIDIFTIINPDLNSLDLAAFRDKLNDPDVISLATITGGDDGDEYAQTFVKTYSKLKAIEISIMEKNIVLVVKLITPGIKKKEDE